MVKLAFSANLKNDCTSQLFQEKIWKYFSARKKVKISFEVWMIGGYWKLIDFIFVYLFLSSVNSENLFYAFNWFFSDDATLIMVNLFIRSFAKIDDVKMEYSVQITFRWQEDLLFSRWPRFPGKSGPMIVWPIPTSWAKPTWKVGRRALRNINQYNILGLRPDQVLDNDRCWQGVDAGHLFQVKIFF